MVGARGAPQELASRYRGNIASLDAARLARAPRRDRRARAGALAPPGLLVSSDSAWRDRVEANDLTTFGRDRAAEIENDARLPRAQWIALDDDKAEKLSSPRGRAVRAQAACRAGREAVRPQRGGGAGAERAPPDGLRRGRRCTTGRSRRWRCRSTRGRARAAHDQPAAVDLYRPTATSAAGGHALYEGLAPRTDVLAACYDALVGDRLSIDRLRGFENPMQPTNMDNELDDETVEAMMTATEEATVARKWFEAKARPPRPRQARARRPVRADRRGARVLLARGGGYRRVVVRALLAAPRGDLPLAASRPATSTCAAAREGRGRLLHIGVEDDPAVRPHELHRARCAT